MGFLMGSNGGLPAKDQLPMGQFANRSATNQEGRVLPLIYGRQRVGCTFISDAFDISAQDVYTGGKGGTQAGTNYYASFAVAVGHGPMTAFHDLFLNGDPVFASDSYLYAAALSQALNVATFQTAGPHGLTTGQTVNIYYADQPEFNGQFTITVVSDTQFQYTIPGSSISAETAVAVNGQRIYATVQLPPIYAAGADSTQITIPNFGVATIYWGTNNQPKDAYLSGVSGVTHPPYLGICYIVFHQLFLGFNQTNVQNVEVVVERTPTFPNMTNPAHAVINGDCNPACIAADMLLNPRLGLLLDPVADVNLPTFDAAAEQFFTEGIGFSPVITRPEEVRSQLVDFLSMVDAAIILDGNGLVAMSLQRASSIIAFYVDQTHLVAMPMFDPSDWSTVINETYLNYIDRDAGWNPDYVLWKDNSAVFAKDRPEPQTLDKNFVTQTSVAEILVALVGQVAALPKTTGKFQIAYTPDNYVALLPGNGFTFAYAFRPALGGVYRVTKRTLPAPDKPVIEVEIVIDRSYIYTTPSGGITSHTTGGGGGGSPPVPALAPVVAYSSFALVDLPPALAGGTPAITALVAREIQSDSQAQVYIGANYGLNGAAPETYAQLTTLNNFAFIGTVSVNYPAGTNIIDQVFGLTVQLTGPDLILPALTEFDALINTLLVFCGDEILSVISTELIASGQYLLQVVRGRFGTPIEAHAAGVSAFLILQSSIKPISHPQFKPGLTAQFKVVLGSQLLSDAAAVNVAIAGVSWRQPPPSMLAVNGNFTNPCYAGAGEIAVTFDLPDAGGPLPHGSTCLTQLEVLVAGVVIYSTELVAPTSAVTWTWAGISGSPASSFVLRATSVTRTDFEDVFSAPVTLNVTKL